MTGEKKREYCWLPAQNTSRNENQWLGLTNFTRIRRGKCEEGNKWHPRAAQKFTGARKESSFRPRWGELGTWLCLLRWMEMLHKSYWLWRVNTKNSLTCLWPSEIPTDFPFQPSFLTYIKALTPAPLSVSSPKHLWHLLTLYYLCLPKTHPAVSVILLKESYQAFK